MIQNRLQHYPNILHQSESAFFADIVKIHCPLSIVNCSLLIIFAAVQKNDL